MENTTRDILRTENTEILTESEEIKRGQLLAKVLNLKKKGDFYKTDWGTKTDLGLFRVVERIVKDRE